MQSFSMAAPQPNADLLASFLRPTTVAFTAQKPKQRHQLQHADAVHCAGREQYAQVREIHRHALQNDQHQSLIAELGACTALCIPTVAALSRVRWTKERRLRRHRGAAARRRAGCIAIESMTMTDAGLMSRLRARFARLRRDRGAAARRQACCITLESKTMTDVGLITRLRARIPKAPSPDKIGRLGVGFGMAFSFVGGLNMCMMIAVSWPLFILRTGGSPLFFHPFTFNPLYIAYFSAIYFAYGTVTTPPLVATAVALSPAFKWMLKTLQNRYGCPYWLAIIILQIVSSVTHVATLIWSICFACAIAGTPVWV